MRVFVTGSTGFIGSHVTQDLLAAGHQVLGMTRSQAGAESLRALGAEPHIGTLEDPASLTRGAEQCDAVIHTAFDHDFAHFVDNCHKDARAIAALGEALNGSQRPLLITSATPVGSPAPGEPADEDHFNSGHPNPRAASERAGEALLQRGLNVVVMRLSQIHDTVKQGLVTELIKHARQAGVSAYVDEGLNPWSAAHVSDTAQLYRLALEHHQPGARYHATAESHIPFHLIAQALSEGLGLPVVSVPADEAMAQFGWLSSFVGRNMSSNSSKTQARLGWVPTGPGLIEDLKGSFQRR
ncbi:SDR family oxidoreductase [Pseudomonas sp. KU26590]|uniref:SDR family oxidoreductase n=1 Tax=Pseudomonas sp. KU26590 TaxID=2991051 RepID=UPI00223D16C2|nr:SDR family oxidoreductase [Pseudomonas sp. KU26590]UZJ62540.1 SDR family oxidoreductase [Pseudomonas sp. KU26590]